MSNFNKKIENLTNEQKQNLLKKIKEKKLGGVANTNLNQNTPVIRFKEGENFVYKLYSPVNFLKTEFVETELEDPASNMVQVEAKAVSLNYRDLMIAMDLYPATPGIPSVLGSDYSGVVTKVGKNVSRFKEGDKVMILSAGSLHSDGNIKQDSHFCKYLNIYEQQVIHMPKSTSFVQAACIPTVFITSYYALVTLGRIKEKDVVLIHTATGGVGLAGIEICKWKECSILATAGNDEKRLLLRNMGIPLVMDSRSNHFANEISEYTNGNGVDVILNTLSGDGMKAGLDSLGFFGRFLQIDKKDIAMNNCLPLSNFKKGISFNSIDIGLLINDAKLLNDIFNKIGSLMDEGAINPIKHKTFSYHQIGDALNYMARSEHTGKLVIDYSL